MTAPGEGLRRSDVRRPLFEPILNTVLNLAQANAGSGLGDLGQAKSFIRRGPGKQSGAGVIGMRSVPKAARRLPSPYGNRPGSSTASPLETMATA